MYLRISIVLASALALSGCITAEQQASVAEPPKPITCRAGADCQTKWSRAKAWVAEHSKYKMETSTDSLIQTSGPTTFETEASPAYKVTKIATGPNEYAIEFAGGCDSIFTCKADFTQTILAAEPAHPARKKKKATNQTLSSM
jgi:hypothetical protein